MLFYTTGCFARKQNDLYNNTAVLQTNPQDPVHETDAFVQKKEALADYIRSMTLEEKICQLFLVSVDGTEAGTSAILYDIPPGGYILFSRNFTGSAEQIIDLTGSVQQFYASLKEKNKYNIPPFFSIDHEGGEVNRLRGIASPLPSARSVARFLKPEEAEELYTYAAEQIAALGIHVNFAPLAETAGAHNKDFLSLRSFGTGEQVHMYGKAFLRAFTQSGVFCVLKHFPGNTNTDPHRQLPILEGSKEKIDERYIASFIPLIEFLNGCTENRYADFFSADTDFFLPGGVLMSHAAVSAYDDKNPACFSFTVVNTLLKEKLGFNGLVFSDDLYMGALDSKDFLLADAVEKALRSGIHMCMISRSVYRNFIPVLAEKIENDSELKKLTDTAVQKVLEAKIFMALMRFESDYQNRIFLTASSVSDIYNPPLQLSRFKAAKQKGDNLYYAHWK
ncbi:glycoside hydrolase family 3 N-terminal domain-containing protein [Treponema sp. OMZ 840]|uniref:glycoside hydrolase family 3 N-terminal domain-containing protein n=1 Tax=Treponema sp. OMZ 840 TaxID=244313 RepID=UPI003D8E6FCA